MTGGNNENRNTIFGSEKMLIFFSIKYRINNIAYKFRIASLTVSISLSKNSSVRWVCTPSLANLFSVLVVEINSFPNPLSNCSKPVLTALFFESTLTCPNISLLPFPMFKIFLTITSDSPLRIDIFPLLDIELYWLSYNSSLITFEYSLLLKDFKDFLPFSYWQMCGFREHIIKVLWIKIPLSPLRKQSIPYLNI